MGAVRVTVTDLYALRVEFRLLLVGEAVVLERRIDGTRQEQQIAQASPIVVSPLRLDVTEGRRPFWCLGLGIDMFDGDPISFRPC